VIINTGNKTSFFAFSSKDQVDRLVTSSVKTHTWLYLAGFMNQHIWNPLCACNIYVILYIQHTFKASSQLGDQEFVLSSLS